MQSHTTYPDPSASSPVTLDDGVTVTLVDSTEPYVHPTIPPCRTPTR